MKHKLLNKLAAFATLVCIIGTQPLSADTVTYIITDPAGSPIAGMNQAGAITWRENYQPFGEKLENASASTNNDIWFGGKEFDDDTELSFFGARYYEPTIGRFVSIDPQGFDEENIFSFGRYAYGNNNPYKFVDPDGNAPILIPLAVAIAKEVAAEVASEATGGATDFLSVRRTAKKAAKHVAKKTAKGKKELNPKLIEENPSNLISTQSKAEMSGSQVKRLTKDMKKNGYDQSKPVDASRNPATGRLEIQDGHHRTEAAKKADLDKIPVQVWE